MHTKDFLAQELRKAGLETMAKKAETGYYHDYLSPLALPCLQLMTDLKNSVDTHPMAQKLMDRHLRGEFDATKEESDEWARSPEGRAAINSLSRRMRKALK